MNISHIQRAVAFQETPAIQAHAQAYPLPATATSMDPPISSDRGSNRWDPTKAVKLPDGAGSTSSRRALRLVSAFKARTGIDTDEKIAELEGQLKEWAKNVESVEAPRTKAARIQILDAWAAFLGMMNVEEYKHWYESIVQHYAPFFLKWMLDATPPRPGRSTLKARTVEGWSHTLIYCIARHTHDPQTDARRGMGLLTKGGLFQQLKDQVAQLPTVTVDYNLDRKYNPKYYFGREQLQIMFTEMLNASGRLAILHQIERMLFTFYMTARPSSLGPVHEIWRKRGYGVCLKHVRVCVLGYMNFRITVHLDEFKGAISGVSADEQRFVLEGVLYMHNLLFDPTIYMVAMLYGRNAFQKKYKSINDLCNDNQAELVIDSSMLQEPLFPEIAPGGSHREFITPLRPALAQAATKSVAYWAQKAGLPCTGVTALRRDAGNMYGLQLGTDKAQDIMNHVGSDRRIFSTHYDRGTANVDVVHIRLGERPGTKENNAGEMLEESARTHSFMDIVVECLLRRNAVAPGHKAEIDVQCNKAAEEDPELIALEDEKQQLYEQYLRCFSHGAKSYKFCIDNVHRIFEFAAGERKQYPRRDPVSFIEGCKLEASELRNKLRVSFDKAANRRYQIKKKFRRRIQQNTTRSYAESPLTGTTEERTTAINDAHKPSTHLVSALMAPPTVSATASTTAVDSPIKIAPLSYANLESLEKWQNSIEHALQEVQMEEEEDAQDDFQDTAFTQAVSNLSSAYKKRRIQEAASADDQTDNSRPLPENEKRTQEAASADDQTDNSRPLRDMPLDDVREEDEIDVFQLPIAESRRKMLEYLLAPVTELQQYELLRASPEELEKKKFKKGYRCPECPNFVQPSRSYIARNVSVLKRHMLRRHSDYRNLELQMVVPGSSTYHCPAGDFEHKNCNMVFSHMLKETCTNHKHFRELHKIHEAGVECYRSKNQSEKQPAHSGSGSEETTDNEAEATAEEIEATIKSELRELVVGLFEGEGVDMTQYGEDDWDELL